jgi:hypothetical protein
MAPPPGGTHVIIVGGVSVNDPGEHDRYPYNFINPAVARAKDYKSDVVMLVFAPPYETRAMHQANEHSQVTLTYRDACYFGAWDAKDCPALFKTKEVNLRHFLDVAQGAAKANGFTVIELRTAADLTTELSKLKPIATIDYFGHSNAKSLFLQYSTGVSPGKAEVSWGVADAAKVPASNFLGGSRVTSFGCNNGDAGGLMEQLRDKWDITAVGSEGRTDSEPIGRGEKRPSSAGGFYVYPKGAKAPRAKLATPP